MNLCNVYYVYYASLSFFSFKTYLSPHIPDLNNLKLMQPRYIFSVLSPCRAITLLTSPTRDSYRHISREVSRGRGREIRDQLSGVCESIFETQLSGLFRDTARRDGADARGGSLFPARLIATQPRACVRRGV